MAGSDKTEDKYEQLLAKIDWRSPHPPKGYQFGAGRGAKGFVTTAELTTVGPTGAKMTREENDFFSAMERMERERKNNFKKLKEEENDNDQSRRLHRISTSGPATRVKLSLDDLATLELPSASSSAKATVPTSGDVATNSADDPTATAASSNSASATKPSAASLVVRSARTEEGNAAEEHIFADERVLTPFDVLKGKVSAAQAGLQNVLAMGSTEEQTTWITHARAYREMGMTRRAYQTLIEGCAVTGMKGKRIWEERLRYLSKDNLIGRRRLLEEATNTCPGEEELWTQLLDVVPPLERVPCLQRAVLACPSSEHLWLQLVHFVPSVQDQRVLLQKALQHTPHLPLLWARLARLESYKTGKEMFQAAAARFPSLALIIEAAKYVEWYALSHWASTPSSETRELAGQLPFPPSDVVREGSHQPYASCSTENAVNVYNTLRTADDNVGDLVRTAQQNYLNLSEAGSRHAWLSMALSLLRSEDKKLAEVEADGKAEGNEAAVKPTFSQTSVSSYVCTASHMFLSVVDPNHKGLNSNAVPATWLSDLTALFPAEAAAQHEVQCALWYTWVLLEQQYLDDIMKQGKAGNASSAVVPPPSPAAMSKTNVKEYLSVVETALLSASPVAVQTELLWLLHRVSREVMAEDDSMPNRERDAPTGTIPKVEEEEEEELRKRATPAGRKSASSVSSTPAAQAQHLPSSIITTVAATLGLCAYATAVATTLTSSSRAATTLQQSLGNFLETVLVAVPLTLSEALYRRGYHTAALAVVDLMLQPSSSASASEGVLNDAAPSFTSPTDSTTPPADSLRPWISDLRLHVARAKLLAAVGDNVGADRCLLDAINTASSHHRHSNHSSGLNQSLQDQTWVKLAVLRRSQGQPVESILHDALLQCPRSWKLWLMLLEEKRRSIDLHQRTLSASLSAESKPGNSATAAPRLTTADLLRADDTLTSEVREVRLLYKKAVSAEHCRNVAAVWIFAAQRIEAELLQNVPAARALLTDAALACAAAVYSTRSQLLARALSPQEAESQTSALAQIGVAQARLEAQYGTPGQALETVQEVLQKLPKTRDGTIAITQDDAVGELLSLFISLEPPASRGRAAAKVMRQLKSREPLALCAVAQLYYMAGQYPRALDQALKAVQASKGRCGDAVGLLWRMADQPVMQPFVRRQLYGSKEDDNTEESSGVKESATSTSGASSGDLTPETVQQWVLSVMVASAAGGIAAEEKHTSTPPAALVTAATSSAELVVPRSGPLWIAVAKAEDPTNVTIRGYRRPVVEMLRDVANRIDLKGHESVTAALLRS